MDYERSRNAEVDNLLSDARNWAANGYAEVRDPKTGGTPLHVAAAKGYIDVSPDNIFLSFSFSSLKAVITKNTLFFYLLFTKKHLQYLPYQSDYNSKCLDLQKNIVQNRKYIHYARHVTHFRGQ